MCVQCARGCSEQKVRACSLIALARRALVVRSFSPAKEGWLEKKSPFAQRPHRIASNRSGHSALTTIALTLAHAMHLPYLCLQAEH